MKNTHTTDTMMSPAKMELPNYSSVPQRTSLFGAAPLIGRVLFPQSSVEGRPRWSLYALFCVFGVSSWLTINAAFIELPVFAETLPEGWKIGSYITLAVEAANIFPFLALCANCSRRRPKLGIYSLLVVGTVASLLLGFAWDVLWFGTSVPLLLLIFVGGAVDCTTSVMYWPYVYHFRAPYVSGLAVGEGMSGVVASLLGIVQSPGVDNRFSVTAFFVCVALLMTCSAAAFAGISRRGAWKKELRDVHTVDGNSSTSSHSNHRAVGTGAGSAGSPTVDRRRSGPRGSTGSNNSSDGGSAPRDTVNESSPIVAGTPRSTHPEAVPELHLPAAAPQDATSQSEISLVSSEAWGVLKMCAGPLLALWWLSFMSNGVLLSFRTYITLPYKNGDNVLFWTGVLVTLADPFAALLTTWPKLRWQRLGWLSALWSILAGYVVVLAFTSPHPPLAALAIGGPLVVLALVITRCLVSYTRSMSLLVLHQRSASNVASRHIASSWAGIMMQAGALIGSVAAFVVVSGTDWLQQHSSSR